MAGYGANINNYPVSYVDDDGIASYIIQDTEAPIDARTRTGVGDNDNKPSASRIAGPRGKRLRFSILPHTNLRDSTYFFTRLGGEFTGDGGTTDVANAVETLANNGFKNSTTFYFIDTFVRVIGMTTGYTIDIPVRYVKKK